MTDEAEFAEQEPKYEQEVVTGVEPVKDELDASVSAPVEGNLEEADDELEASAPQSLEEDFEAEEEAESVEAESDESPVADEVKAALRELRATAMRGSPPEGAPDLTEAPDDRAWFVVHCYSGYENKVKHNLEQRIESMGMSNQIFQVVVPTEEEIEVKEGKRRTVERRVFPGYILVQMIMNDDSWYVVRNTPGVTGFVGMGNKPTPLRTEEVSSILKRMEAEAPKVKVTFKPGQKVRIVDGPFNDFMGTVDEINMDKAKVRVMVSFFGRETPVELDFLQVEKM